MESLESYAILDRPGHQALAFAVWEVPVSGQYRFFLETDSACDLLLDGASLCRIQGFYPQNGNGKIQYLPKGPHLLLFQFSSGPNKGWVDLKVQPPGQTDFARIKPAQLRYVTLNNFPEWWMIFHFLKWALIIGACFVFLFLWRTELSVFLRSGFLFSWLAARHPFLWAGLGLITIVSILGIWPFSWNYLILPRVNNNNPGFQVEAFVDKEMTGSPLKKYSAPLSILNLEPTQAALRAYAVWRVPHTGVYRLNVACMGYGHLTIDEQRVVSFPERVIDQSESVYYHLNQGLHLVRLNLFNFGHPGSFSLTASGPGSSEAQLLTGQELSGLPVDQMVLMMRIVDYGKYTGLIGLSLALILLFIKLGHWDTRLSLFLKQAPLSFYAMGVSVIVALSLILRIIFLLDIPDPAVIPKGMALGGLLSAFGSLGGIFYIFLINRLNKESADQSWDGLEAIALMAIMAIAAILRVLFLPNMEFKSDEKEMVHMAINLGRDHIPYVVGNLTSHGNRNPAGFL
ncbi:MAG TPA: hypothetical protein VK564_06270, partial [Thermodesulfobacteriota bacterium]|nr:hypothetical protein [Thermodesulfobacteriota bacterium]